MNKRKKYHIRPFSFIDWVLGIGSILTAVICPILCLVALALALT